MDEGPLQQLHPFAPINVTGDEGRTCLMVHTALPPDPLTSTFAQQSLYYQFSSYRGYSTVLTAPIDSQPTRGDAGQRLQMQMSSTTIFREFLVALLLIKI